ncbi:MAG: 4Fe-4S binding protein, partial [Dehalococcoidia bacterium]
ICAFKAISFNSGGDRLYDRAVCMGCGMCTEKCEQGALSLAKDPDKGEPLDLDLIRETLA